MFGPATASAQTALVSWSLDCLLSYFAHATTHVLVLFYLIPTQLVLSSLLLYLSYIPASDTPKTKQFRLNIKPQGGGNGLREIWNMQANETALQSWKPCNSSHTPTTRKNPLPHFLTHLLKRENSQQS
ncbi:hypothetical protein LY76DRAFT_210610 [Colletotrichum caudatum]|nr:hypothetical protein LY76DRAFT_210610 [Colletotrichum caudatum]